MAILVTGGAGFIGSHTVVELQNAGYDVVVLDNLSNSSEKSLERVEKITGKPVKFYKKDILDHLILEVMARFYQELIPIANRQNSFREFYRELCQALMALHETSLAYFSAVAGKIAYSEKITKNNKALKNIAMTGEQIHQIIAKRITDAAEKKELGLNAPVADVMMLFWLCLTGLVEKSSHRESYFLRHLEKDRKSFLDFAFNI